MRILCIETATPVCSIALVEEGKVVSIRESEKKNAHAEVVTLFIQDMLNEFEMDVTGLDAVSVSMGPGSYTGLRIGVSTAKGLCYAGSVPLIAIPTLQSMAYGALRQTDRKDPDTLYCPMIDARRMEVYSALYDGQGKEFRETKAEIIDEHSFADLSENHRIVFFGDGADKCRTVLTRPTMHFLDGFKTSAAFMAEPATNKLIKKEFEDVAYFEPYYLKDFIAGVPRVKGLR